MGTEDRTDGCLLPSVRLMQALREIGGQGLTRDVLWLVCPIGTGQGVILVTVSVGAGGQHSPRSPSAAQHFTSCDSCLVLPGLPIVGTQCQLMCTRIPPGGCAKCVSASSTTRCSPKRLHAAPRVCGVRWVGVVGRGRGMCRPWPVNATPAAAVLERGAGGSCMEGCTQTTGDMLMWCGVCILGVVLCSDPPWHLPWLVQTCRCADRGRAWAWLVSLGAAECELVWRGGVPILLCHASLYIIRVA